MTDDLVCVDGQYVLRKSKLKAGRGSAPTRVQMVALDAVKGYDVLLSRWLVLRAYHGMDQDGGCFWWLPWESVAASKTWPQSKMNDWLEHALAAAGVVAPVGFSYTYHSLRAGAATAAHSIGVSERKIRSMGNWAPGISAGRDAIDRYIDPTVPPTPGAWRLFGWLAPNRDAARP